MALYDEANPSRGIPGDSEAAHVLGLAAVVRASARGGDYGVLHGYYTPDPAKVKAEMVAMSARTVAAFTVNPTPSKYADDTMNPGVTFAPVPGMEQHVKAMNSGYDPYAAKEPKTRPGDHPSTASLVGNVAARQAGPLASDEAAMLALVAGA